MTVTLTNGETVSGQLLCAIPHLTEQLCLYLLDSEQRAHAVYLGGIKHHPFNVAEINGQRVKRHEEQR